MIHVGLRRNMPAATYSPIPFPIQWLFVQLAAMRLAGRLRADGPHGKLPRRLVAGPEKRKARDTASRALVNNAGSDLLSHTVSHTVPSAVSGLTSVFGMGTGGTLIL